MRTSGKLPSLLSLSHSQLTKPPPPPPQFVPILLGVLFSCVLLGSVLQLSLRYFTLFPEPQFLWRRLLVLFVTLLQALQTSFDVARALQVRRDAPSLFPSRNSV